jgi:hypothetical protein
LCFPLVGSFGGLTISLEGGLDDVDEFFFRLFAFSCG